MRHNTLAVCAVMALCAMAVGVQAGTLEGELDGELREWHIVERGGNSTAYFSNLGAGMQTLTVQGHAEDRFARQGSLSINLTVMNGDLMGEPEISYFPESGMFPSYSSEGGSAVLENFSMQQGGDGLHVSGEVHGSLFRMEGIGQPTNHDDAITITVRFDAELRERD